MTSPIVSNHSGGSPALGASFRAIQGVLDAGILARTVSGARIGPVNPHPCRPASFRVADRPDHGGRFRVERVATRLLQPMYQVGAHALSPECQAQSVRTDPGARAAVFLQLGRAQQDFCGPRSGGPGAQAVPRPARMIPGGFFRRVRAGPTVHSGHLRAHSGPSREIYRFRLKGGPRAGSGRSPIRWVAQPASFGNPVRPSSPPNSKMTFRVLTLRDAAAAATQLLFMPSFLASGAVSCIMTSGDRSPALAADDQRGSAAVR